METNPIVFLQKKAFLKVLEFLIDYILASTRPISLKFELDLCFDPDYFHLGFDGDPAKIFGDFEVLVNAKSRFCQNGIF